jgi:hypothetical protein
LEEARKKSGE